MQLIDTHAHLDELAFDPDVPETLERAREAGVIAVLTIGINADTSRRAVALAEQHPDVYAVVGIQPNYVSQMSPDDWDEVVQLADHPRVLGVGETGLDRYWDYAPIELQQEWFDRHLELSRAIGKPFVVHCREAEADVVAQLRRAAEQGPLSGVMHSFCGDAQTLAVCLELGMHISFAGMVTYKRNAELRRTAALVPSDRLLVETDSPYLAPTPHRGKRNEPAHVVHTAQCLAEARGVGMDELAEQTTQNAIRLFRIPGRS
ncbi:MAG: TatD family hydrolase [Planctomycetaceae bacterium]|nr:TatD family hydrolase [Planctomycetaceae bacterium]